MSACKHRQPIASMTPKWNRFTGMIDVPRNLVENRDLLVMVGSETAMSALDRGRTLESARRRAHVSQITFFSLQGHQRRRSADTPCDRIVVSSILSNTQFNLAHRKLSQPLWSLFPSTIRRWGRRSRRASGLHLAQAPSQPMPERRT